MGSQLEKKIVPTFHSLQIYFGWVGFEFIYYEQTENNKFLSFLFIFYTKFAVFFVSSAFHSLHCVEAPLHINLFI